MPRRYYKKETVKEYIPCLAKGDISKTAADNVQAILDTDYKLWILGTGDCNAPYTVSDINNNRNKITEIYIGDGVKPTSMHAWFAGLTSLNKVNRIPDSVTDMSNLFGSNCNVTFANNFVIPEGVTNIDNMFANNTENKIVFNNFVIPSSVTTMKSAFYSYYSNYFSGRIIFNCSPTSFDNCFYGTAGGVYSGSGGGASRYLPLYIDYTSNCTNIDSIIATHKNEDSHYYHYDKWSLTKGNLVTI